MNEVVKPGNLFLDYGNAAAPRLIVGDLLVFAKGDYAAGRDKLPVPLGSKLTALMHTLWIGWQKWRDTAVVDHRMGAVVEGFRPCRRDELGDLDESKWESDGEGGVRDPWQLSNLIVMVEPPNKLFTFTSSSRGGMSAIGELCKEYGRRLRQFPEEVPIVELDVGSYLHRDRSLGRIKFPIFKVTGWTDQRPLMALLEAESGRTTELLAGATELPAIPF
jgi:hypothetical protein